MSNSVIAFEKDRLHVDRSVCVALCGVAFATLLLEVDLIRLFSFVAWYHFAYLIISVAMLGFGAAGAVVARFPGVFQRDIRALLGTLSFLAAITACAGFAFITKIPFIPQALPSAAQFGWLTAYYLTAFVPFFFAGLVVAIVLSGAPSAIGRLYFWDLVGAGFGSLGTLAFIIRIGVPATIMLSVIVFAISGSLFLAHRPDLRMRSLASVVALALLSGAVLYSFPVPPPLPKALHVFLSRPNTTLLSSEWHPVARVDTVEYPVAEEYRQVPGSMTRLWYGDLPADKRILYDGDASPAIVRFDGDFSKLEEIDHLLQKTPYLLVDDPKVLIIGIGGGFDVLVALYNNAREITGVDVHPVTVDIVKNRYADYAGRIYDYPNVTIHAAEGRNFLKRSGETFDLIQMTTVDSLVARTVGAYILSESYLFTVDAIRDVIDRLSPNGVFSIVDGDPGLGREHRHALREAGLITTALRERGVSDPAAHMIVLTRHRGRYASLINTLVRMTPFTAGEVQKIRHFAATNKMVVYHYPGADIPDSDISQFINMNVDQRERWYDEHHLNLRPTTDDSPFFFNFYKWRNLLTNPDTGVGRQTALGQIVLLTMLVQSIVFSFLFIIAPLPRLVSMGEPPGTRLACFLYFAALGIGFMFLEISFIQRFVLFLGSPAYAVSVVLAGLLVMSGVGSYTVQTSKLNNIELLTRSVLMLALVAGAYALFLPAFFEWFPSSSTAARFVVALLLITPLGLVLGRFVPIGVRVLADIHPGFVPWAWGINTCTSVISTVLAVILAMQVGFRAVSGIAIALYVGGSIALGSIERRWRMHGRPANA